MAQNKSSDPNDVKSLIRHLEDKRDVRIQSSIEKEFLLRDLAAFKDKLNIELTNNEHLKQKFQQLKDINECEQKKHEIISSMRSILAQGNLNKVLSFSEDQVEKYKKLTKTKQVDFEKKLKDQIEDYTKKNPMFLQFEQKKIQLAELEQQLSIMQEEAKSFAKRMKKEKQINNLLFEQNVVEMSQHALRYYNLFQKLKHPNQKIHKPTPLKPMAKMSMRGPDKSLEPMEASNENEIDGQSMPEATSTSKEQEMFDTNEDNAGESFDLTSPEPEPERSGMRNNNKKEEKSQRYNEVANKEPSTMFKSLKIQSILNKKNVKDDNQKKEHNSEQAKYDKHSTPIASSLKVSKEGPHASQRSQKGKPKVTFADTMPSQSSSFESTSAKDKGVSSSTSKPAAMNDLDMDMDMELELLENDNENQSNDNDENDVQMDGKDIDGNNSDENFEAISDWTSLEAAAENRNPNDKKPNSPESKCSIDLDDFRMPDMPLQMNHNTSKSNDIDYYSSGENYEMGENYDMGDLGDVEDIGDLFE